MKAFVASHLKDMNRKTVYKLISSVGEISKAEISRQTGISTPTVIKIINFFLENGFVYEAGEGDSSIGRKPQILKFNSEARFSIGVDYEGDFLKIGIVDLLGNIKTIRQIHVEPNFDAIIEKLCPNIEKAIRSAGIDREKVLGIGLGLPGVLDPSSCKIDFAPLIGIFDSRDCSQIISELGKKTGLDIFMENDVNAAAVGEYITRKLSPNEDLVYISLGTGLGSGIIMNGEIRRGKRNAAGEIGYMVYDKDFKTSKDKAGWLESRINLEALKERWDFFDIVPNQDDLSSIKVHEDLFEVTDYTASHTALCIANIASFIDMDYAVVGGITPKILGNYFIDRVNSYLARLCFYDIRCEGQYSSEPGVIGSATIVMQNKLDEILVE